MVRETSEPVLIYLGRYQCPACVAFDPEWEKIKQQLQGRARFVKFTYYPDQYLIPPPLVKYSPFFPSLILASPRSYYRAFTPDDKISTELGDDWFNYTVKAFKFNAVETPHGYEPTNRPFNAENAIFWFNQMVPKMGELEVEQVPRERKSTFYL